jgi:hypothetical protein
MSRDIYDLVKTGNVEEVRRELHSHPEALNQPNPKYVSDIVISY